MTAGGEAPALDVRGLVKEFAGQRVLDRVDFAVVPGEIHALLGENGAGKSTLIKVIAGVYQAEAGTIAVAGRPLPVHFGPAEAGRHGLRFVHQDLGLVDGLSVAENVALDAGYCRRRGLIDFAATERRVAALLARAGCRVSPSAYVGELSRAEKVMVAVARAFSAAARLIVLDEVTASLPAPEVKQLTAFLRRAQRSGVGFVFVTHRLDEIFGLADRVTVLRDGKTVATARPGDITHEQLVHWIVGRAVQRLEQRALPSRQHDNAGGLRVSGLDGPGLAQPLSFDVAPGEVLALSGLIGCGAREVVRMLAGASRRRAGTALLDGRALPLGQPHLLARAGCAYVPGDRHAEGTALDLSIRENLFLARLGSVTQRAALRRPWQERQAALALMERFAVRPAGDPERLLATLSGGNQQKVVIGRALHGRPRLLLLDEPTAGVDVGARVELHQLIREAADHGTAVVFASSDFDEVASEASRALVMRHGSFACEMAGGDITYDRLIAESH